MKDIEVELSGKSLLAALLVLALIGVMWAVNPAPAHAQATNPQACSVGPANANRYLVVRESSLSSSTETITIQQPAGATTAVALECMDVYASVATEIFFYQNQTPASTTAMTVTPLNTSTNPNQTAYRSSNVGSGSPTAYKAYYVPAGGTMVFDLSKIVLPRGAGTSSNWSVGTSSVTGTVRIQIQDIEQ